MSNDLLRQVEESIRENQEILDLAASLARLQANRDFRKVLLDGFFKDEAARLVREKQNPMKQTPEAQRLILTSIDSIGSLYQYFRSIEERAEMAGKSLDMDEQTHQELLAEGLK